MERSIGMEPEGAIGLREADRTSKGESLGAGREATLRLREIDDARISWTIYQIKLTTNNAFAVTK